MISSSASETARRGGGGAGGRGELALLLLLPPRPAPRGERGAVAGKRLEVAMPASVLKKGRKARREAAVSSSEERDHSGRRRRFVRRERKRGSRRAGSFRGPESCFSCCRRPRPDSRGPLRVRRERARALRVGGRGLLRRRGGRAEAARGFLAGRGSLVVREPERGPSLAAPKEGQNVKSSSRARSRFSRLSVCTERTCARSARGEGGGGERGHGGVGSRVFIFLVLWKERKETGL